MSLRSIFICIFSFAASITAVGQSSDVNFPTPLETNAVSGTVKPRDIGDARLTTYYFAFGGDRGDMFVSVITKHFDGDIDIFIAEGMLPLAKIVVYSDGLVNETGKLIYLRKPENLLLRIQGRPPGDDPATFQIKFGGGFVAARSAAAAEAPRVASTQETDTKVNSVGTIIERKKPETVNELSPKTDEAASRPTPSLVIAQKSKIVSSAGSRPSVKKDSTSETVKKGESKAAPKKPVDSPPRKEQRKGEKAAAAVRESPPVDKKKPDPLMQIRLLVVFKDGRKIDRPMTEIEKVTIEGSNLVVVLKDGRSATYSLFTIDKFAIDTP